MGLDNATVKEFANLINPFDKTSGEATVYGRVVGFNEIGGRPKVQLDGSSQIVPIRTTVKVKGPKGAPGDQDYYAGDRVLVRIKNHEALIVSNISTQMITAEGAEDAAKQYVSDNGFIYAEKITGEQGDFYTLSADKFTATEITGALGHFITVNADRIITDAINAQIANIDTIKASDVVAGEGDFAYLNVDNVLDAKMANLDIANINRANVNSLFVKGFAIATDATIVNGHITGYLDSVEINANKITAGTLLVDRLYIKDQNNKWKMQTVDGQGHTVYVEAADRINERTITADKLVAHSITTDELNATNITANNSSFMESLTDSLTTNYLFATQANVQDLVAHSVDAELAELDILNINEELKSQNIHLGEIVFDQPSKPSIASDYTDYILGIERETKTITAYDSTALYSEGDYVTHYYSKDNILVYPYYNDKTKTENGITFTDNGDGSITCNGTATADAVFYCSVREETGKCVLSNGSYIVNGCPSGGATSSYYIIASRTRNGTNANYGLDLGSGISITLNGDDFGTDDVRVQIRIVIKPGTTVNNLTFKPKIRLATNEDATWYPFIKGVYKCIKPITTAELWDENKWYYLRDAINGDQYEFDHVRYTDKINSLSANELTVSDTLNLGKVKFNQTSKIGQFSGAPAFLLGIEAFADGGDMKWQQASSVAVGKATSDKHGNDISLNYIHHFKTGLTSSNNKFILITINSHTSWMLSFNVNIYTSYVAHIINFSGYNNGTNHWYSPHASLLTSSSVSSPVCYFGYTATNYMWVAIQVGNYTGISISDVANGYTQITDFNNLFTISRVDSLPGTIQSTQSAAAFAYDLRVGYINGIAVGSSPKFTDTWPTKTSQLTNDSAFMVGRSVANTTWPSRNLGADTAHAWMHSDTIGTNWLMVWAASAFSDKRIKKNIKDSIVNALDIICKLEPKEFDFITKEMGDHTDLGYIAQNVEEYIPEAITNTHQRDMEGNQIPNSEMKIIAYEKIVPYLIKAIQEQQEQINKLEEMIK